MALKRKRGALDASGFWSDLDWSLDKGVSREITGLGLMIAAILMLLAIFGSAGKVGVALTAGMLNAFGALSYLIPFVLGGVGVILLFPKNIHLKASSYLGIFLALLFLAGLLDPRGGLLGATLAGVLRAGIGGIGTFVLLLGFFIVALMVAFNLSLKNFLERLFVKKLPFPSVKVNEPTTVSVFQTVKDRIGLQPPREVKVSSEQTALRLNTKDSTWNFPPLELLDLSTTKAQSGNITKNVEVIQKTLKDFGIDVAMGEVNIGPTVTQYSLKPSEGVKLNQITARQNDLALALAAHPLRIEAPIPGKAAVGIEIPNKVPAIVTLREIFETDNFKASRSNLSLALGRDVAGAPIVVDLQKMPHLLIAGSTGSGKSIGINAIILALLYQNSPADLRFILVDPKRVEFAAYNGIPHLLTPVVTEADKTVNVLKWAVAEMEHRFRLFAEAGSRDIGSYNAKVKEERLPYIVIIIDELADLMAQSANEVEGAIVRLAQMARATGMHLVVATQRPSVDVITGLIKANITTRVAFAVASQIDSRTILDMAGAEKLLGNGDMLYLGTDFSGKPKRIQGALVTEKEIRGVTDFLKKEASTGYDESILEFGAPRKSESGEVMIDDEMFDEAKDLVLQAGKASASFLQRRLRIGYARAARLLDLLEAEGLIGPADGAKPRDVIGSRDPLDKDSGIQG